MSAQDTDFYEKTARLFDQKAGPFIMGILNVTPDSFFDGGKYSIEENWLEQATKMICEGADIIDIGAYSTRPGATGISEEEESERLIKVILSVRKHFPEILISADTFRAKIADQAVKAGANIINDISGGNMDAEMFETIAKLKVPYILMHIQGTPDTMQQDPQYDDVTEEVYSFFEKKLAELKRSGVTNVILDPGFGFGKSLEHNYSLLNNLDRFQSLNCLILAGLSRKSIINKALNISSKDAINGTTIVNTIALQKGVNILRVHDVKEAKEIVKIMSHLKKPDQVIESSHK